MEENANRREPITITKEDLLRQLNLTPKMMYGRHELAFELDDPDELFVQKAKDELRETPEIVAQGLKELREFIAGEPDLYVMDDDEFYKVFLRPCKWYAKSAFSLMKRYYRFHQAYPNIFANLLPSVEKEAFCSGLIFPSPLRNEDGCRLVIIEAGKRWKPKEVSLDQLFKGLIMTMKAAMMEPKTQIIGLHVIIDMEGFSLGQVTYFTPSFAKMVVDFVQKCLPMRLKSINVVNQSFLFSMVFALFKPFLEEKIRKRIHIHGTNRESLISVTGRKALFKKYGGEVDYPNEPFGDVLWHNFLTFEDVFEVSLRFGYGTAKTK